MNFTSESLVTVLTPVYNGEKYLSECIESVLVQTYENWEYVIVNNCSTDRSLEIAQGYAKKDPRIRIHNNREFVDIIQNHNIAFQQIASESKYCKMVHADDWLFPDCITRMVDLAEANPTVGIVGAYGLNNSGVKCIGLPYASTVVPGREVCRRTLLGGFYVFGSPTSNLIRSDLIQKRKRLYNESHIHADNEACFDLLQECDFGFVHQVLTYSRQHNEARTSLSVRFNSYLLGTLIILTKYGPIYLEKSEYEQCLRDYMDSYYRFLAESLLYRMDKELIDYHTSGLRSMGHPFSWAKLLAVLGLEVLDILGNPKNTLERLARRIRRFVREGTAPQVYAVKLYDGMNKGSSRIEGDWHA